MTRKWYSICMACGKTYGYKLKKCKRCGGMKWLVVGYDEPFPIKKPFFGEG